METLKKKHVHSYTSPFGKGIVVCAYQDEMWKPWDPLEDPLMQGDGNLGGIGGEYYTQPSISRDQVLSEMEREARSQLDNIAAAAVTGLLYGAVPGVGLVGGIVLGIEAYMISQAGDGIAAGAEAILDAGSSNIQTAPADSSASK